MTLIEIRKSRDIQIDNDDKKIKMRKIYHIHGECKEKFYDIELWYVGIKRGKSKKSSKIFFLLISSHAKKICEKRFGGYFFSQIMIMSIYQIYENVNTSIHIICNIIAYTKNELIDDTC